jgi:hypothetical protein
MINRLLAGIRRWMKRPPPEDPCVGVRVPLRKGPQAGSAIEAPKER